MNAMMITIDLIFPLHTTSNCWEVKRKAGLSLFNIYDRKNEWYAEYNVVEGEILETEVNFRGFTPSLFVTWNLY